MNFSKYKSESPKTLKIKIRFLKKKKKNSYLKTKYYPLISLN